eukprot:349632-Chlamydomonas_euryale.AAC.8
MRHDGYSMVRCAGHGLSSWKETPYVQDMNPLQERKATPAGFRPRSPSACVCSPRLTPPEELNETQSHMQDCNDGKAGNRRALADVSRLLGAGKSNTTRCAPAAAAAPPDLASPALPPLPAADHSDHPAGRWKAPQVQLCTTCGCKAVEADQHIIHLKEHA